MGERTTITASDGFTLNAYAARPASKPIGGVVLIQEVWGLNDWIRSEVDRYAAEGFLTVAPAMFDRVEFGYESNNYGPEQFAVIGELMKKFDHKTALLDVAAAITTAADGDKVGITGYCFGGAVSWRAAAHEGMGLSAASGYYGGGVPNYIDLAPRIPTEMHFGDQDKGIPLEQIEALKARHPEADIYTYPADHGFCNSARPGNFNADACAKANARTLDFFRKHLG
ncbi:MAG: dienelactone hydrolase family protein [Candidatus Devosia phytovorans]|uniref:Dienelactone hydrolase family protein n=1 Tax=Candidatus Devosia phytovorans TaxID=3121372 RepID=A0AAJ5VQ75_9HYPH|nr:dienelactone hydrolase family protein [Devosia sp.]WEK02726.1 MAG: dienelactone hydrolase family protein [Devosia sp.]